MSEQELIILAARGDEQAFRQLYDAYDGRLARFIKTRMSNTKDAEDLLAMIWEKIILHLLDFEGRFEQSFQAWIFTVARNTLINFYKSSQHREIPTDLQVFETKLIAENTHVDIFQKENLLLLLKSLPVYQAEVIKLKYFEDLKNKEIAKKLGLPEKTVAVYLSKALRNLEKNGSILDP